MCVHMSVYSLLKTFLKQQLYNELAFSAAILNESCLSEQFLIFCTPLIQFSLPILVSDINILVNRLFGMFFLLTLTPSKPSDDCKYVFQLPPLEKTSIFLKSFQRKKNFIHFPLFANRTPVHMVLINQPCFWLQGRDWISSQATRSSKLMARVTRSGVGP